MEKNCLGDRGAKRSRKAGLAGSILSQAKLIKGAGDFNTRNLSVTL